MHNMEVTVHKKNQASTKATGNTKEHTRRTRQVGINELTINERPWMRRTTEHSQHSLLRRTTSRKTLGNLQGNSGPG